MEPKPGPKRVTLYADGGCEPNPGVGGYGVVLLCEGKRRELTGGFRLTTNNRMELMGAIAGLEAIRVRCQVIVHSDSRYVVNAMSKGWLRKWQAAGWRRKGEGLIPNSDLWKRLAALCEKHDVTFRWVRGHSGIPENERCDQLATRARRARELPDDPGYSEGSRQPETSKAAKRPDLGDEAKLRAGDSWSSLIEEATGTEEVPTQQRHIIQRLYEVTLSADADAADFEAIARELESKLHARLLSRMREAGRRQWEFDVDERIVLLQLHPVLGITLTTRGEESQEFLLDLADRLRRSAK